MEDIYPEAEKLAYKFKVCSKLLNAIGDETRQHILIEIMKIKNALV